MATDVAEAISLSTGLDYRSAYRAVASQGVEAAAAEVPAALDPAEAIASRTVPGGAAPEPMDSMLADCRDAVARARAWVERERDAARARRAGARGARTHVANLRPGPWVIPVDPPTSPGKDRHARQDTDSHARIHRDRPGPRIRSELDSRPQRIWTITEERRGQPDVVVDQGNRVGGRVDRTHESGSAAFEFTGPKDGVAEGQITSSASGRTFDVYTQSPTGTQPGLPMAGPPTSTTISLRGAEGQGVGGAPDLGGVRQRHRCQRRGAPAHGVPAGNPMRPCGRKDQVHGDGLHR